VSRLHPPKAQEYLEHTEHATETTSEIKQGNVTFKHRTQTSKEIRQELDFITRNIDRLSKQSKKDKNSFVTAMVINDLRDNEINRVTDMLRQIDAVGPELLEQVFKYKEKEDMAQLVESMEVAREVKGTGVNYNIIL
jgi:hypothetical protein